MDRNHWKLGDTSALFESQGTPDTVSSGAGDHGGVSYGTFQLSSKTGTAKEYVDQSKYSSAFKGLEPGSDAFGTKWKEVARDHSDFGADQANFIKATHVTPVTDALAARGIDVSDRGPAVQDMIWSMSVQYRAHTPSHIQRGLTEAYGDKVEVKSLTDSDIVKAVQHSKLVHVHQDFKSSTPLQRQGVETRIRAEESALVRLADTGTLGTVAETNADWKSASPVQQGSSKDRVVEVQQNLHALGVLNTKGEQIVADGDFGPSTRDAVKTFQTSVGLPATGSVGALTMLRLQEQANARHQDPRSSLACTLDDASHPDHGFFQGVREHVANLDRSLGRQPDQHTDNISSALVVQARADGMHRIDQVALSPKGDVMWAVQTPPGRSDHLFDLRTSVPTTSANTPMASSAAKWPEAMQQFQAHEHVQQASQQQLQQHAETQQAPQVPSMGR